MFAQGCSYRVAKDFLLGAHGFRCKQDIEPNFWKIESTLPIQKDTTRTWYRHARKRKPTNRTPRSLGLLRPPPFRAPPPLIPMPKTTQRFCSALRRLSGSPSRISPLNCGESTSIDSSPKSKKARSTRRISPKPSTRPATSL